MSEKFIITLCLVVLGTVLGFAYSKNLSKRKTYFEDLNKFINRFVTALDYDRRTVVELMNEFNASSELLKEHFVTIKSNILEGKNSELRKGGLDNNEYKFVVKLLSEIGTLNAVAEKRLAEKNILCLSEYCTKSKQKYEKLGKTAIKLGFLFGLLVSVLFW